MMKGYTNVSVDDCQVALSNWKEMYTSGLEMRNKGIDLYYTKHVTNGNYWNKFIAKNKTPEDYVIKKIPFLETWASVLHEVLTEDELKLVRMWNYSVHEDAYIAVKSLIKASEDGRVLLDDQLCWFVNKYK